MSGASCVLLVTAGATVSAWAAARTATTRGAGLPARKACSVVSTRERTFYELCPPLTIKRTTLGFCSCDCDSLVVCMFAIGHRNSAKRFLVKPNRRSKDSAWASGTLLVRRSVKTSICHHLRRRLQRVTKRTQPLPAIATLHVCMHLEVHHGSLR
jgi:hypothetical protein